MILAEIGNSYPTKPVSPRPSLRFQDLSSKGLKMSDEIWKPVQGFPQYMVSSHGRMKSVRRIITDSWGRQRLWPEKVFATILNSAGYPQINLGKWDTRKTELVHRIVAATFIPNPLNKPQVNHKDGNRANNRVDNLEWVTCAENLAYSRKVLHAQAERELTPPEVAKIILASDKTGTAVAAQFGIWPSAVYNVWKRNGVMRKKHKARILLRDPATGRVMARSKPMEETQPCSEEHP